MCNDPGLMCRLWIRMNDVPNVAIGEACCVDHVSGYQLMCTLDERRLEMCAPWYKINLPETCG